jgi:hypothetical protein
MPYNGWYLGLIYVFLGGRWGSGLITGYVLLDFRFLGFIFILFILLLFWGERWGVAVLGCYPLGGNLLGVGSRLQGVSLG